MDACTSWTRSCCSICAGAACDTAALLLGWIRKNLEGCENPRQHGKGLTANHSGEWRYRVGDYRLLADIQDECVVILMLHSGHRREIYS